jgi:hypothetical protein
MQAEELVNINPSRIIKMSWTSVKTLIMKKRISLEICEDERLTSNTWNINKTILAVGYVSTRKHVEMKHFRYPTHDQASALYSHDTDSIFNDNLTKKNVMVPLRLPCKFCSLTFLVTNVWPFVVAGLKYRWVSLGVAQLCSEMIFIWWVQIPNPVLYMF